MMRLPSFHFASPKTLDEAAALLTRDPENTRLVAGGTDLWPNMKRRNQKAETVISLSRVEELFGVRSGDDGSTRIGAMTSLSDLLSDPHLRSSYPGFARALASISSPTLRNMSTLGGNLCLDTRCSYYDQSEEWRRAIGYCMKECGETCWVAPASKRCFAISSSDSAPLLCAIDAQVELVSVRGKRRLPLAEFFKDDGIDYLAKTRDEILSAVELPAPGIWKSSYWKLRRRGSIDFPVLGVGAAVRMDGDRVGKARIFLGALTSAPISMEASAAHLEGRPWDAIRIAEAAAMAKKASAAFDNADFDLKWRRQMVEPYLEGALREIAGLGPKMRTPVHGTRPLIFDTP